MKIFPYLLIAISTFTNHGVAQIEDNSLTKFDSTLHLKIFRFRINTSQIIELIERTNCTYEGRLINAVWKTNRKQEKKKLITEELMIPAHTVAKLFEVSISNDVEVLETCREVDGCVIGLDGTIISFDVFTGQIQRSYWYWSPESDYYQNPEVDEIKKVRAILNAIRRDVNYPLLFKIFTNSLSSGNYKYDGIIMQKL